MTSSFTIPGLTDKQGAQLAELLQRQLSTYNDLHLTLKHIHWNVVGPNFIGVHEMIDPQVELVRGYADDVALDPDLPRLTKPFRRDELAAAITASSGHVASASQGAV